MLPSMYLLSCPECWKVLGRVCENATQLGPVPNPSPRTYIEDMKSNAAFFCNAENSLEMDWWNSWFLSLFCQRHVKFARKIGCFVVVPRCILLNKHEHTKSRQRLVSVFFLNFFIYYIFCTPQPHLFKQISFVPAVGGEGSSERPQNCL